MQNTNGASDAVPLCFSSGEQYRRWKDMATLLKPGPSDYCTDCTAEFQAARVRDGRCAFPGVTFHLMSDGFIDGVRPGCELPGLKLIARPARASR
jgi:hypothetical protein